MSTQKAKVTKLNIEGKVSPNSKLIEEDILGLMLMSLKDTQSVKEVLKPIDFYNSAHQKICEAIYEVSKTTQPDIVMVAQKLTEMGELDNAGGAYYLVKLTNRAVSSVNLRNYCLIVKQNSLKRSVIDFCSETLKNSFDETCDIFNLISEAETNLKQINFELAETKVTSIGTKAMGVISEFEDSVYKAKNNIVDESAIYTGLREWDEINGKLFPGLYIVAGRPGMGKGVHMTEMICRMGKQYNIGVINGEMTDEQLLKRIGCNLMGIDNLLFKKNPKYVTDEEIEILKDAMQEALNLKLHIENSRYINKIENRIKLWVANYGVKCVFADFLTLFKVPPELEKYYTKTQQVDYILDIFTFLCKELKIPIILYVQMNREILGRHGIKEPNLADLKQSGSIEELAYQVSFLHRPEYYDEKAKIDEFGQDVEGLMYQIIAKHRDGRLGRLKLKSELAMSQIKAWEDKDPINFTTLDTPF